MIKYYYFMLSIPIMGFIAVLFTKIAGESIAWILPFVYFLILWGVPNFVFLIALSFFNYYKNIFKFTFIIFETFLLLLFYFSLQKFFDKLGIVDNLELFRFIDLKTIISYCLIYIIIHYYASWKNKNLNFGNKIRLKS